MNKKILELLLFVLIFSSCAQSADSQSDTVCLKDHCIDVEVVIKKEDVARGLMRRARLDRNSGMLFVFQNSAPHSFWMKNTLIPLDMIWIDQTRKIIHIESHVPPCQSDPCPIYTPPASALYVLEVNGGYADELGMKIGDEFKFRIIE